MQSDVVLTYHKKVLWIPTMTIFVIWFIYWIEINFGYNFNDFGILPRDFKGLRGIFLSPFIYSSASHLFNISFTLFVLL